LEIDPPALGSTGVTDVHIESMRLAGMPGAYLQTSPEYYLKRLLARGFEAVYSLGKAFRQGEQGRYHHPEFTLLEWYRPGWDEYRLMAEVQELIVATGAREQRPKLAVSTHSFSEVFADATGIDPHAPPPQTLQKLASDIAGRDCNHEDDSICLDLIFSLRVEPVLPRGLCFLHDYPVCQAALAATAENADGQVVARRFEVFWDGLELANGYFELTDVEELGRRFQADNQRRLTRGQATVPVDEKLLAAINEGLPPCAGVALGVDRLLMKFTGSEAIQQVLAFTDPFDLA